MIRWAKLHAELLKCEYSVKYGTRLELSSILIWAYNKWWSVYSGPLHALSAIHSGPFVAWIPRTYTCSKSTYYFLSALHATAAHIMHCMQGSVQVSQPLQSAGGPSSLLAAAVCIIHCIVLCACACCTCIIFYRPTLCCLQLQPTLSVSPSLIVRDLWLCV